MNTDWRNYLARNVVPPEVIRALELFSTQELSQLTVSMQMGFAGEQLFLGLGLWDDLLQEVVQPAEGNKQQALADIGYYVQRELLIKESVQKQFTVAALIKLLGGQ